ncbi:MAG: urea ABC transporter permease subunit UrtB [Burkholderiaceae bacterium]
MRFIHLLILLVALVLTPWRAAQALTSEQALAMAQGSNAAREAAIEAAATQAQPGLAPFLEAMQAKRLMVDGERVLEQRGGTTVDAVTGDAIANADGADAVKINNRLRRAIAAALASLALFDDDRNRRLAAAIELSQRPSADDLALLQKALEREKDPAIRAVLGTASGRLELSDTDPRIRESAARRLGASDTREIRQLLRARLTATDGAPAETNDTVRRELRNAYASVEFRVFMGEISATLFAGISLGSVLLLAALGLAITYGLMGVINLAHGELMMIGAYATYVVQQLFRTPALSPWFDAYLIAAIPVAFVVAALVGALLERLVIRHLYGRALETLLATWGISLILMQAVRSLFGAQNVAVENPSWMSGGLVLGSNLVLPWNRIAIVVFAILVLAVVASLILRTRLGLFVRAATQNRTMARCMGVPTSRTDTLAFALGAGIAGLAGCALSQIGNVGPDLGQAYIVDSFLVVVVGGVGQLSGAVVAALGLGVFNKILEGMSGAVIAKIILLVAVIVFIQKRPQGIFALRGRSADA